VRHRQLEALWVLSKPSSGMTDLLGHAVCQTSFNLAILAHVGVRHRQLDALCGLFEPSSGMTLLGHAVGQT
jgi:hypothetical protein